MDDPMSEWSRLSSTSSSWVVDHDDVLGLARSTNSSPVYAVIKKSHPPAQPRMARVSDWIEQQQVGGDQAQVPVQTLAETQHNDPEPVHGAPHAPPVTPPPQSIDHESQYRDLGKPQNDHSESGNGQKRVYNIETLLGMRYTQSALSVMLRVKPEAIAENIFQYMGGLPSRRLGVRSRGLSDISNISRGSINPNANKNVGPRPLLNTKLPGMNRLQRQAPAPIDVPLAQQNEGFVRFLQQHASPPHHRVTAGGRIVPAGPTSPPPMLDYNSLNGLIRDRAAAATANPQNGGVPSSNVFEGNCTPAQPVFSVPSGTGASNRVDRIPGQSGAISSFVLPTMSQENAAQGYQAFTTPTTQMSPSWIPMGTFPDGSVLVACNGITYRTYWNGCNTVMEPLNSFSMAPEPASFAAAYAQNPYDESSYGQSTLSQQVKNISASRCNPSNEFRGTDVKPSIATLYDQLDGEEKDLQSKLTSLDKHLALYHFEITPVVRTQLVAQRRYLVEALDKIRVSKTKDHRPVPIIAPSNGIPNTPVNKFDRNSNGSLSKVSSMRGEQPKKTVGRKGLSPAAAPFVPGSLRGASVGNPTKRTLEDIASAAAARKDKTSNVCEPSENAKAASYRDYSSSSVLDPSDPAMRVVDFEDIEYASRYLYNWNLDKKTFCTTVAEFQEAIKQVREHARRYGCLGGQSKDPAYDAEQDIWWAICDRDPITLPPSVPDYVSNPRPWNWEDSVFNYRRKGAPPVSNGLDHARKSPRLIGWDLGTTERMKDNLDVTRSYYASKGQLPTVPFRTWAYDRKGNKVAIEPESGYTATVPQEHKPIDSSQLPGVKQNGQSSDSSLTLRSLNSNEIYGRDNVLSSTYRSKNSKNLHNDDEAHLNQSNVHATHYWSQLGRFNAETGRSSPPHQTKLGTCDRGNIGNYGTPRHSLQAQIENFPETTCVHVGSEKPKEKSTSHTKRTGASLIERSEPEKQSSMKNVNHYKASADPIWNGEDQSKYNPGNPIHATSTAMDRISPTATRSPWGPGQASRSPHRQQFAAGTSKSSAQAKDNSGANVPHVNIPPTTAYDSALDNTSGSNCELRATRAGDGLIPENSDAQKFLRKMLQSPIYTTVRPHTGKSYGLAERLSKFLKGGDETTQHSTGRVANKENAPSNRAMQSVDNPLTGEDGRRGLACALKSDPNISVTKIQSSLSSPNHQVFGNLPSQVDAETAHTASPFDPWGHLPDHVNGIPVGLPHPTSSPASRMSPAHPRFQNRDNVNSYHPKSIQNMAVNFGFDGGADSQMPERGQTSTKAQEAHPTFDLKGVTHADYQVKRDDPNNAWHKGTVKDYFEDLAEKEHTEILAYRQSLARRPAKDKV